MSASNIPALARAIAKLLAREPSDAIQLAELAVVVRILREAVRDEQALERIDWLLLDLRGFIETYEQREALDEHHYDNMIRRLR